MDKPRYSRLDPQRQWPRATWSATACHVLFGAATVGYLDAELCSYYSGVCPQLWNGYFELYWDLYSGYDAECYWGRL